MGLLVVSIIVFLGLLALPVLTALPSLEAQRRQAEQEDPLGKNHQAVSHSHQR